jgi:uncharacterized protein
MENESTQKYTAFNGVKLLAHGALDAVVLKVKRKIQDDETSSILVFSDSTGKQMDFDLSGSESDVLKRLEIYVGGEATPVSSGPGRPKLGVISREISLLPRHWEWLSTQSGGASATLRRLVDEARKHTTARDEMKRYQERTYKFMSSIAGNLPLYEEALRALFAKDEKKFKEQISDWPRDIKNHALKLAEPIFI